MANHFIYYVYQRVSTEIIAVPGDKLQANNLTVLSNFTFKKTNDEKFGVPHNFFENQLKISG